MVIRSRNQPASVTSISISKLIAALILFLWCMPSYGQTTTISGVAKSTANGKAVPFVTVRIKHSGTGITADARGKFILSLRRHHLADTITLSALGYHDLHVPIKRLLQGKQDVQGAAAEGASYDFTFSLSPKRLELGTVEIKARPVKWKETKVGFNMDKGAPFQHEFEPLDTVLSGVMGQEIANSFRVRKYPVHLKDLNFGLLGSGNMAVRIRVRIYSLRNDLPHESLLAKDIVVKIPPHHTGWIRVNLERYHIMLDQDFAVALEWINEANQFNSNSLMTFARMPKQQVTSYRSSGDAAWKKLRSTSIGMYVTLLHE
jgi:hypothetical protein